VLFVWVRDVVSFATAAAGRAKKTDGRTASPVQSTQFQYHFSKSTHMIRFFVWKFSSLPTVDDLLQDDADSY